MLSKGQQSSSITRNQSSSLSDKKVNRHFLWNHQPVAIRTFWWSSNIHHVHVPTFADFADECNTSDENVICQIYLITDSFCHFYLMRTSSCRFMNESANVNGHSAWTRTTLPVYNGSKIRSRSCKFRPRCSNLNYTVKVSAVQKQINNNIHIYACNFCYIRILLSVTPPSSSPSPHLFLLC